MSIMCLRCWIISDLFGDDVLNFCVSCCSDQCNIVVGLELLFMIIMGGRLLSSSGMCFLYVK